MENKLTEPHLNSMSALNHALVTGWITSGGLFPDQDGQVRSWGRKVGEGRHWEECDVVRVDE